MTALNNAERAAIRRDAEGGANRSLYKHVQHPSLEQTGRYPAWLPSRRFVAAVIAIGGMQLLATMDSTVAIVDISCGTMTHNTAGQFMNTLGTGALGVLTVRGTRTLSEQTGNFKVTGSNTTANGIVNTWQVKARSVRIADIELYDVDVVVLPADMPYVLLGNSFLSRFQMKRDNDQLVLERRF